MDMLEKLELYLECTSEKDFLEQWSRSQRKSPNENLTMNSIVNRFNYLEKEPDKLPLSDLHADTIKNNTNSDSFGVFF